MAQNTVDVNLRKYNNDLSAKIISLSPDSVINAKTVAVVGSATRSTTTATVTMPKHGFVAGDSVVITGDAPFAGTYTVLAGATEDVFQYTVANSGATASDVKAKVTVVLYNMNNGAGNEPVKMQVTGTLSAFVSLMPAYTVANVGIIADGQTPEGQETIPSESQPVAWPLATIKSFEGSNVRSIVITDMDRALTVVTATSVAHGLKVGDQVVVDASDNALDGTWAVASVPTADTFTFNTVASGTITNATGTGVLQRTIIWVFEQTAAAKKYILKEAYATVKAFFTAP